MTREEIAFEIGRHIGSRFIYTSAAPCADYVNLSEMKEKQLCLDRFAEQMKKNGVKHIAVLLTAGEIEDYYSGRLLETYEGYGFEVLPCPIEDSSIPRNFKDFVAYVDELCNISEKDKILVHCFGGFGRTGLVVAALLIKLGSSLEKAIQTVREKKPHSIETEQQEEFLRYYALHMGLS